MVKTREADMLTLFDVSLTILYKILKLDLAYIHFQKLY